MLSIGDIVVLNFTYINTVLIPLNDPTLNATIQAMELLGTQTARVLALGTAGVTQILFFVRVLPTNINSPQYNNGLGVVFYFLNLTQLNNTVLKALYGLSKDGDIFVINPSTGAGTLVGNLSISATELAYDSSTGRAWAQSSDGAFTIQEINILTGTVISPPVSDGASFTGLAFVDNILYGAYVTSGGGGSPSTLATLNPVTGVKTDIGPTGISAPMSGLAWDGFGNMYALRGGSTANLYKINLLTGAATLIGNTGIGNAGSLRFGANGILYAGATDGSSNLYTVNIATAASTLVGSTGFSNITGLALV